MLTGVTTVPLRARRAPVVLRQVSIAHQTCGPHSSYDRSSPPSRRLSPRHSYLVCAEEFFENNPLVAATLQPHIRRVYAVALGNFRASSFASRSYELHFDL